jgi:hypothetical protein
MNQQIMNLQKEKERLESEKNKALLYKDKYSSMFQFFNEKFKSLEINNISNLKNEEERRKEVSSNFQKQFDEFKDLIAQLHERNIQLNNDNDSMHQKYTEMYENMNNYKEKVEDIQQTMKNDIDKTQIRLNKLIIEKAKSEETFLKEKTDLLLVSFNLFNR